MQPWRSRQMQATHTPTRLLSAWHRRASSSTASHAPARGASWERDTPRVLTGGDFCNGDIHGHEECSTDKRQTAYPSELLDATKYPHHAINLLLQAPGPVLHPVCREERGVRRTCLALEQPCPGHLGVTHSGCPFKTQFSLEEKQRLGTKACACFPLKSGPGGPGSSHILLDSQGGEWIIL